MRHLVSVSCFLVGCGDSRVSPDAVPQVEVIVAAPDAPAALVAYRAGDEGVWATAAGTELPIQFVATDRYTVAIGCHETAAVVVYDLTVSELTSLTSDLSCQPGSSSTAVISGSITAPVVHLGRTTVAWGTQTATVDGTMSVTPYSMTVPYGTHDLVAAWQVLGPGGGYFQRAQIVRGLQVSGDVTLDVDLTPPEAELARGVIGSVGEINTLITADQSRFRLSYAKYNTDLFTYVPESRLGPDDRHEVSFEYSSDLTIQQVARVPAPDAITAPEPPMIHDNYATWTSPPAAVAYWLRALSWTVFVSPMVFETTETLTVPDLSTIPGWTFSEGSGGWSVAAIESDAALEDAVRLLPRADTRYFIFH